MTQRRVTNGDQPANTKNTMKLASEALELMEHLISLINSTTVGEVAHLAKSTAKIPFVIIGTLAMNLLMLFENSKNKIADLTTTTCSNLGCLFTTLHDLFTCNKRQPQ